jgi:hypothetical protein
MKLLSLLIALALALPTFASAPTATRSFENVDEIRNWAKTESFGGSEVDIVKHGDVEAAIVRRSFTSGVQSCVLSVFVKDKKAWVEAIGLRPFWGTWLGFKQSEDIVSVTVGKEAREVLRFSISELRAHDRIE